MKNISSINKYFKKYKLKLFVGILFILLSDGFQVVIPFLLKKSIDNLQNHLNYSDLVNYAGLIVGAALISGFFRFLIRETIIVISREIEFDLRQDFWNHLLKLPYKFFQDNSTGNLMAHATNDISAVRMYVGPAVMYSIDTLIKITIVLSIMFSLNAELTFYALLPLPVLSYFVFKLSSKIHIKYTRIQEKFSELTAKAQENISGIRVIKSYVRENSEIESFSKLGKEYFERNLDKVRIQALFMPILFIITGFSVIITILLGGNKVITGELSLGDISAFIAYLGLLTWPMIAFGWVANIIQQADSSMKRLNKIFSAEYLQKSSETGNKELSIDGAIEFKEVKFRYNPRDQYVLEDINFKIDQGKTLAIVGHTGSGKSTIVNLITRLYDATEGTILIDGKDIKNYTYAELRRNLGVVPQEAYLFSDTLRNNILYGTDNKDEKILQRVADISRISNDVNQFPEGYETILGERGITLSGGQKQRTGLARALAVNPKILIMDDSFSAVDTKTEEEILKNLREKVNCTKIIISHRISTVKDSDLILVLDKGRIAERGTHEELVSLNGIYAELHFKQLLEDELKEIN